MNNISEILLSDFNDEENSIEYCNNCNEPLQTKVKILGKTRIMPIKCQCELKKLKEEEAIKQKQKLERDMDDLIYSGLMDRKYLSNTFENDNMNNPKITNICKKYVENWEQMKKENIGILLYGDVGLGKTYYACAIVNELFKNGVSVCVTSFPKIINKITNFDNESKVLLEKMQTKSLLVIDDLGVERNTEFALEQMFTIINDRLMSNLPVIITTNLDLEEIKNETNINKKRIYDRILEMCPVALYITSQNKKSERQARAKIKTELARKILL